METYNSINEIPLQGTAERTARANEQLRKDLAIYSTRAFLNRQERNDLGDYYSTWGINRIIALFNFDKSGNYLPQAYHAPKEFLRMLYPIDEIMQHERCGTLIIDREQYSPELRKLSYFIYMVDAELYDQYKTLQNFRGQTAPTFMFNQHANDGVRIFRDYFALVRHLRKQRYITYCLGPRTAFYLRYYLYQINVHTISDSYAFGEKESPELARLVTESIKRHLAFNDTQELDYKVDFTEDKYAQYRLLQSAYKTNLPPVKEYKNDTHIVRFSKQRFFSAYVYHPKNSKLKFLEERGIYAYNHLVIHNGYAIFYVWDTRQITKILPETDIDLNWFVKGANDNGNDLVCSLKLSEAERQICEQLHEKFAIQMRDTEDWKPEI